MTKIRVGRTVCLAGVSVCAVLLVFLWIDFRSGGGTRVVALFTSVLFCICLILAVGWILASRKAGRWSWIVVSIGEVVVTGLVATAGLVTLQFSGDSVRTPSVAQDVMGYLSLAAWLVPAGYALGSRFANGVADQVGRWAGCLFLAAIVGFGLAILR